MSAYYANANDLSAVSRVAEAFGFCLVKGVFGADEMMSIERDLAMAHAEFGGRMPDLYSVPSLQWLLYDERIRQVAQALLGDRLVYYRESNLAYEKTPGALTKNPFTEYHCDARGTPEALFETPPRHERAYGAYRFAIYFRDYSNYSGGLKVAPASHLRLHAVDRRWKDEETLKKAPKVPILLRDMELHLPHQPMELHNVPSQPGDLVIFSLRCFHAAGALRLMDRPNLAVLPRVERSIERTWPDLCAPVSPGSRNAIFFDFGAPGADVDYYAKWRAHVAPADLDAAFSYRGPPPSGIMIRNDRIILPLAQRIVDAGAHAAPQDLKDLFELCKSHTEFAPEHALFDRPAFLAAAARDPVAAAHSVAREILARRQAQFEAEERRIATG